MQNQAIIGLASFLLVVGVLFLPRASRAQIMNEPQKQLPAPKGSSPLGLRNNNPFNLEYRNIGWVGEIGTDGRFSIFDTAENGIRAGMINVHTKMTRDQANTIRKLLTRLSPAFENPLDAFIGFVSRELGIGPDAPLDFKEHIIKLSKAIIRFENGQQPFSDNQLTRAYNRTGRA